MIDDTATRRAIVEAARERRVGAPVYLRYAAEIAAEDDVLVAAAAAVDLARQVLGPIADVYAVRGMGTPVAAASNGDAEHLALTVRHGDGSVALLGIGRLSAGGVPVPASLLLVGDRGVVEGCPAPSLPGTLLSAAGGGDNDASDAAQRPARATPAGLIATVRRSLQSGRPEPLTDDG